MRVLIPIGVALILGTGIVTTILWHDLQTTRQELQTERQLTDDLRLQLAETKAVLAARPAAPPPVTEPQRATEEPAPQQMSREAAAAVQEATRLAQEQEQGQEEKDALVAMPGRAKYEQLRDFEHTAPSRTRVTNLDSLLARSGRPLSNDQKRALTKLISAEQKRQEAEAQALRDSGQATLASQQDRVAEGNRRILDGASAFLDAQQLELVRGQFEQRGAIDRASNRVRQIEQRAVQEPQN